MIGSCNFPHSAVGYEAFMDGNGDVEGDYTLVALNPPDPIAEGLT